MRFFVLITGLLASLAACAQEDAPAAPAYELGKEYFAIDVPVRTITPGKIEVTEVFWYGCGHCFHFEPTINAWKKTLADDVELVKSPAMWRENMQTHARIFYAAKALDLPEKFHLRAFAMLNTEHKRLESEDEIAALFAEFGVEREKFDKVFNSFGVSSQVQQADARARGFKITGTPELIVDGRYRIATGSAGGQAEMLEVANYLIDKIRSGK